MCSADVVRSVAFPQLGEQEFRPRCEGVPEVVRHCLNLCWQEEADQRPDFQLVSPMLAELCQMGVNPLAEEIDSFVSIDDRETREVFKRSENLKSQMERVRNEVQRIEDNSRRILPMLVFPFFFSHS